jgi:hypothetical protein
VKLGRRFVLFEQEPAYIDIIILEREKNWLLKDSKYIYTLNCTSITVDDLFF